MEKDDCIFFSLDAILIVTVLNQKPIILGKKQTRRFTRAPGNGFITYFICMFPLGANNGEKNRKKNKKAYKICKGDGDNRP